jgi:hypothetical protein
MKDVPRGFMTMRQGSDHLKGAWLAGLLAAGVLWPVGGAHAASRPITYPWCTSGAGQEYGSVNCGFSTFEQCLDSARGNGQSCGPNPFYEQPHAAGAKPHIERGRLRKAKER